MGIATYVSTLCKTAISQICKKEKHIDNICVRKSYRSCTVLNFFQPRQQHYLSLLIENKMFNIP